MQSHLFLTSGKLNTISVVTPVTSKPVTSVHPSHTYVSDEESGKGGGGGDGQRIQPLSLVLRFLQILRRPSSLSLRWTSGLAVARAVRRRVKRERLDKKRMVCFN